jgi:hypothetical protein
MIQTERFSHTFFRSDSKLRTGVFYAIAVHLVLVGTLLGGIRLLGGDAPVASAAPSPVTQTAPGAPAAEKSAVAPAEAPTPVPLPPAPTASPALPKVKAPAAAAPTEVKREPARTPVKSKKAVADAKPAHKTARKVASDDEPTPQARPQVKLRTFSN